MRIRSHTILRLVVALPFLSPILLYPAYRGDKIKHFMMEISAVFLALSTAVAAFNCSVDGLRGRSGGGRARQGPPAAGSAAGNGIQDVSKETWSWVEKE